MYGFKERSYQPLNASKHVINLVVLCDMATLFQFFAVKCEWNSNYTLSISLPILS